MILDLADLEPGDFAGQTFDVVIVGAGPAGITLATRLPPTQSVLLLEAGDLEFSEQSQDLYAGGITGRAYVPLDITRLRYFGGSSNHWGGWCRQLDAADFEAQAHVPHSGWPIGKADLDPYAEGAAAIVDADTTPRQPLAYQAALAPVARAGDLRPFDFLWSPPTRFNEKFRRPLAEAANITCLLNASLTGIALAESGRAVRSVRVGGYDGATRTFAARRLVLAAGGLENPRILLNCDDRMPGGIGNGHDVVGRFFADHPHHRIGTFVLEDRFRGLVESSLSAAAMRQRENFSFYEATPAFLGRHALMGFGLRVMPMLQPAQAGFMQRLRSAVCAPDWLGRAADAVTPGNGICADGWVHLTTSPAPNPDSRVRLNGERDRFGWRRIDLDWRMSAIDRRTVQFAAVHFARLIASHDIGRLRVADWILQSEMRFPGPAEEEAVGNHHMGTTRMADDPKHGVVDRDCRVHGIDNLYIAGSSVFPTYGHVNPTFTIVQLALRLADHLTAG